MNRTKFSSTISIRNILIANEELNLLVNNNIFPVEAPIDTNNNYIVYMRDEYSKDYVMQGIYNENCRILLSIFSNDYDESITITEIVNEILEGFHEDYNIEIRIIDSTEEKENDKYIQTLLLTVE